MIERLARLILLALVWAAVSAMGGQPPAPTSEKRVALVIGNGAYTKEAELRNPANDARAIAAALRRMGFDVVEGIDLDHASMNNAILDYDEKLRTADTALFFYAGHGVQVDGVNYLLPTDANPRTETQLDIGSINVDKVLRQMERAVKTKVIILDACRNNPFERQLARSMGASRSSRMGNGLAKIDATGGSVITYATAPGAVADDGAGEHSPFTTALLTHMETPGLDVNDLMILVNRDVLAETNGRQRPWVSMSLSEQVYLGPSAAPAPAPVAPPAAATAPVQTPAPQEIEMEIWRSSERGGLKADYESYLRKYPDGLFADLARNRITALSKGATASAPAQTGAAPANQPYQTPQPYATGPSPADAEAALGMSREDRAAIQSWLSMLGYDTRGVDGVFGPGSRAAIREWQEDEGFAPTGYLDMEQIEQLVSGAGPGLQNWTTGPGAGGFVTPTFNAYAYCSMTGAEGYAAGVDPNQALWEAVNACIYNGGVPQCCANGARLLQ